MIDRRRCLGLAVAAASGVLAPGLLPDAVPRARAAEVLRVAYAGSMGAVMDHGLGPAFSARAGATFQGIGQGSFALARLLAGRQLAADVFVPVTAGPFEVVREAGLATQAVPVASTQMCIAYSPKSRFAKDFAAAAEGRAPWYDVLLKPGVKFGRTDPRTDPQGRNIIFAMLLAERYYHLPGFAKRLLGPAENPKQIFTEPSLLSRLEAGQIDASSGYLSAVKSHHLPFIPLPAEVNLSDPAQAAAWYDKVRFDLTLPDGKTKAMSIRPLVFYASVLSDAANRAAATGFVRFMTSPAGQRLFAAYGYSPPLGGVLTA